MLCLFFIAPEVSRADFKKLFKAPPDWSLRQQAGSGPSTSRLYLLKSGATVVVTYRGGQSPAMIQKVVGALNRQNYRVLKGRPPSQICYEKTESDRFSLTCTDDDQNFIMASIAWNAQEKNLARNRRWLIEAFQ